MTSVGIFRHAFSTQLRKLKWAETFTPAMFYNFIQVSNPRCTVSVSHNFTSVRKHRGHEFSLDYLLETSEGASAAEMHIDVNMMYVVGRAFRLVRRRRLASFPIESLSSRPQHQDITLMAT